MSRFILAAVFAFSLGGAALAQTMSSMGNSANSMGSMSMAPHTTQTPGAAGDSMKPDAMKHDTMAAGGMSNNTMSHNTMSHNTLAPDGMAATSNSMKPQQ